MGGSERRDKPIIDNAIVKTCEARVVFKISYDFNNQTMNNQREETEKSLDKIISTAQNMKRSLSLLDDNQCGSFIHRISHEIIDERLRDMRKDLRMFVFANSIIDKFCEAADVNKELMFKKDNLRKKKHPANDRAKEDIIDARRVLIYILSSFHNETIGRYLNLSRYTVETYKQRCSDLLETDKKFKEYHGMIIKSLTLESQIIV